MKRITPDREPERNAERLKSKYGKKIEDRASFDRAFFDMTEQVGYESSAQEKHADQVFKAYQEKYKLQPKKVEPTREGATVRREGAPARVIKKPSKEQFSYVGYHNKGKPNQKVVFARVIFVKGKNKSEIRYIDKKGRYVTPKKNKT